MTADQRAESRRLVAMGVPAETAELIVRDPRYRVLEDSFGTPRPLDLDPADSLTPADIDRINAG